jgi:hypothetical protein
VTRAYFEHLRWHQPRRPWLQSRTFRKSRLRRSPPVPFDAEPGCIQEPAPHMLNGSAATDGTPLLSQAARSRSPRRAADDCAAGDRTHGSREGGQERPTRQWDEHSLPWPETLATSSGPLVGAGRILACPDFGGRGWRNSASAKRPNVRRANSRRTAPLCDPTRRDPCSHAALQPFRGSAVPCRPHRVRGLSRRRSRVRVPSLPSHLSPRSRAFCACSGRGKRAGACPTGALNVQA